jgi:hypothetical protein
MEQVEKLIKGFNKRFLDLHIPQSQPELEDACPSLKISPEAPVISLASSPIFMGYRIPVTPRGPNSLCI